MKLSIGQAWDETKGVFRADGKAIFAIALALTVLPGAIIETAAPSGLRSEEPSLIIAFTGLAVALLGLASQIAVSRIALGPSTTVGEALAQAFRRLPMLFGALVLAVLPFVLAVGLVGLAQGGEFNPRSLLPGQSLALLLILLIGLYVLIRLLFLTPLAADRPLRPIALLKEGWKLSRGRFGKLLLLLFLVMLVAVLLLGALGGALSAVVILLLGAIEPGNVSALLVALIQQGLSALVSVLFVVVVCRLYAQAVGGEDSVSVPHAGGE
jgi:hypothetical protein